jgi:uncharacterized membrane protein YgcG
LVVGSALGLLRIVPRPVQILLLVIGLTVGATQLGSGLRLREWAKALTGVVVCGVALAAWWFPFSGWPLAGWLLLGFWTWAAFSAAKDPPPPKPEREPGAANDTAASSDPDPDEPWFLRRYTRPDPFLGDDDDDRPRRRRDRDWFGGSGGGRSSGGDGGFGGGSSSGGGASGRW